MAGPQYPHAFAALPWNERIGCFWGLGIVVAWGVITVSAELYRAYAYECLHFASGMETPSCKAVLLEMANTWLRRMHPARAAERILDSA